MFRSCTRRASIIPCLTFAFLAVTQLNNALAQQTQAPTDPLKPLQWRSIGPYRGGRVDAVTGVASQPMVFYYGATGGGVWKTTDGGINWEVVSDASVFGTGSVGAWHALTGSGWRRRCIGSSGFSLSGGSTG